MDMLHRRANRDTVICHIGWDDLFVYLIFVDLSPGRNRGWDGRYRGFPWLF